MNPMATAARDVIIVGGGIVGLATGWQLLQRRPGTRLLVIEKEPAVASHQTGHNSGVIHSGLYYKPGSLRAKLCREGGEALMAFCEAEGVPYDRCGKVVVATREEEHPRLEELHRRGVANGLAGLRWLGPEEIKEFEPHCIGTRALHVPQAGIVSFRAVAEKYAEKIRAAGGEIALGERVETIRAAGSASGQVDVVTTKTTHTCRLLVACAGLQSDRLALQTQPDLPMRIMGFRGEYYELLPEARKFVRNLIYPVPDPSFPFLGLHFTRVIDGRIESGPNAVFAFGREAYTRTGFNLRDTWDAITWPGGRTMARRYWRTGLAEFHRSFSKPAFVRTLQRMIPEIREEHLIPGGAGVRAMACGRDGTLIDDFHILDSGNVVHVCNAPSPAATASLAIGSTIASLLIGKL
jgi:(S)-2-hydroxyglutarate dehydrogenase